MGVLGLCFGTLSPTMLVDLVRSDGRVSIRQVTMSTAVYRTSTKCTDRDVVAHVEQGQQVQVEEVGLLGLVGRKSSNWADDQTLEGLGKLRARETWENWERVRDSESRLVTDGSGIAYIASKTSSQDLFLAARR